jgi:adenosylcobinamide-phosphate synthase
LITGDHLWLLALALVIDAVVGDPDSIWRRIPHPVVAIGGLIGALDRAWNTPRATPAARRRAGIAAVTIVVTVAAGAGYALELAFAALPFGWIGTAAAASVLLAGRSLYDHVAVVADALHAGDATAARAAVGKIVGRDTAGLDASGVTRATIESLAENLADGVVAPAFWFALLGLPGLAAYKAINTADSMIGHLTARHRDFGWAAARLDDLANFAPSRIAGGLIAAVAGGGAARRGAFRTMLSDAQKHASPNAGWPEAAMAGATGLALGGPRTYGGIAAGDVWLNPGGRRDATERDIRRAVRIYIEAVAVLFAVALLAGLPFAFV